MSPQSIAEYEDALKSGILRSEEVIRRELENIGEYNEHLNAFITIFGESMALGYSKVQSKVSPKEIESYPLYGVPLTIKDNIFVAGQRTTAGSAILKDYVSTVNADVVDSAVLAGCVPLGKTNLHELAMGATSTSSFFGPVRNPVDPSRIAGGSSGGSAVSVAKSKIPIISLGTDTGGSVRIPAALCGVCGFKPTLGLISASGVVPLSPTLDHVGIMTKNIADMSLALSSFTGTDHKFRYDEIVNRFSPEGIRIGIPGSYFFEDCISSVEKAFWNAIDAAKTAGFLVVEDVAIPEVEKINRTRLTIQLSEMCSLYPDLVEDQERRRQVGKDVLSFFDRGASVSSMELLLSSRERLSIIAGMSRVLQSVDFLVMPTCLTTAPKFEEVLGHEAGSIRRQLVRNTELFNLCGLPSLTIPSNPPGSTELPTGIEICGSAFDDENVLAVGEQIWKSLRGRGF